MSIKFCIGELCQWEEAEAETIEREDQYRLAKRHLARYGSIERKNAFTKTLRLAPLLDQTKIMNELAKPCERGARTHNCLDACRTAPEVVLRWRKLWYSMPKSDRDSRLAHMFRCSKEDWTAVRRTSSRSCTFSELLGFRSLSINTLTCVCREAFMIITGIHAEAIQRARMLAQGIAPLTLGKWVSERSLSYGQCRAWLLDHAKVHEACGSETGSDAKVHEACGSETPAVEEPVHDLAQMIKQQWKPRGGHEQGPLRGQVAAL